MPGIRSVMLKARIALGLIKTIKNWPHCYADYFRLIRRGSEYTALLRDGTKYRIRPHTDDITIILEIYGGLYSPPGFEPKKAMKGVVVDIGAQIGVFSVLASKSASKVYSFEPIPGNFRRLKQNIAMNRIKNIVPSEMAVTDKAGERSIFISDNTGMHSFFFRSRKGGSIKVKTKSLADIMEQNRISSIDFLKLDCEGSEYEILFSCSDSTLASVKRIAMEYHDIDKDRNGRSIKRFLEKKGFNARISTDIIPMIYAKRP